MTELEELKLLDAIVDRKALARLRRQTRRKSYAKPPKYNPDNARIQVLRFKRKLGIKT